MNSSLKITVVFPNQSCDVYAYQGESLLETLIRHRIPLGAVHIELHDHGESRPLMGHEHLDTLQGHVVATVNRNIGLFDILRAVTTTTHTSQPVTSFLANKGQANNPFETALIELSEADIFHIAEQAIQSSILESSKEIQGHNVLVGFSGGGDSNLLLTSLCKSGLLALNDITPVMILGIPDWDQQLTQAQDLCAKLGFSLRVIDELSSASMAGIDDIPSALSRFKKEFPNTNIDFFGTWLIRRVLSRLAENAGARFVFLGGNREDTIAEILYCLFNGTQPLPFPSRTIGNTTFINPLYTLPKRVIDAAYPDYSTANYRSRTQSNDVGRTVYYYIAHILQESLPGADISFLNGVKQLANENQFEWDEQLEDIVHKNSSSSLREKWLRVIKGDRV